MRVLTKGWGTQRAGELQKMGVGREIKDTSRAKGIQAVSRHPRRALWSSAFRGRGP